MQAGKVTVRDLDSGRRYHEGFDHLVLATGAVPARPLGARWRRCCGRFRRANPRRWVALLVGLQRPRPPAGRGDRRRYIGVEMADALARRHMAVTVVDRAPQPMSTLDPDMGELVLPAMEEVGIDVRTDATVTGFEIDGEGRVRSVVTSDGAVPADVVVLGLGVRPNTALADQADCRSGHHGGLCTPTQTAVLAPMTGPWAGGDCLRSLNPVSRPGTSMFHLGTHAVEERWPSDRPKQHCWFLRHIHLRGPGMVVSKVCTWRLPWTGVCECDATYAGFWAMRR